MFLGKVGQSLLNSYYISSTQQFKAMFRTSLTLAILALFCVSLQANGVVVGKHEKAYMSLKSSSVEVTIENQVAITKATQVFYNDSNDTLAVKYGFPVPENASATGLRYYINGVWKKAVFSPAPPDPSTGGSSGGGGEDYVIQQYLGTNPLYFDFEEVLGLDSTVIVELSYVELLEYKFGKVSYTYPNNYSGISSELLDKQEIRVSLSSNRLITDLTMLSHSSDSSSVSAYEGYVSCSAYEAPANWDYALQYSLSQDDLGLFSLSTFVADSLSPDGFGQGFFAFIVEPDPSEQATAIQKVFTLVIDRSGSMSGDKIVQAKEAATFIVNNMNMGDLFNIVSFALDVTSFRPDHVAFNAESQTAALAYISSIEAMGGTNISGAFDTAIPQFSTANDETANIIIFLTDGEQTDGITNTGDLITHINDLVTTSETEVSIFTFGIGSNTNERLLTSIASDNGGLAEFLANDLLEEVITEFYLQIQNPVLLHTRVAFDPEIIVERYPVELQNLYKGNQLMIFGRYTEAQPVNVTFSGTSYSMEVEYQYELSLSDTTNQRYQFLPKLWAKMKMEELISLYYQNLHEPELAEYLKESIIELSVHYGVISPFTSFAQGGPEDPNMPVGFEEGELLEESSVKGLSNDYFSLLAVRPNPAADYLAFDLRCSDLARGELQIFLRNAQGQLVYAFADEISALQRYTHEIDVDALGLAPGVYVLVLEHQGAVLSVKVVIG